MKVTKIKDGKGSHIWYDGGVGEVGWGGTAIHSLHLYIWDVKVECRPSPSPHLFKPTAPTQNLTNKYIS